MNEKDIDKELTEISQGRECRIMAREVGNHNHLEIRIETTPPKAKPKKRWWEFWK